MKKLVLWLCLALLSDCKSHKKLLEISRENVVKTIPQQVFELELTRCYGLCPAYKIVVFENDSLSFEGFIHVAKLGQLSKKLAKGTTNQLVKKFKDAGFFKFQNQYTSNMSDFPTTYISFTDRGFTKKIMDYDHAPESLKLLEMLISDLVKEAIELKN
jgi:hypothetical protein